MSQLHKRIGQHVRRFPRHFTKYLYERDTIFATIWVFIFIVVLGSIPLNLSVLNPLKLALKDFDVSDMTYSELGKDKNHNRDSTVVIVNIRHEDREMLAMMIDKVSSYKPKVIGLDALFYEADENPYKDSLLAASISRTPDLVLAHKLQFTDKGDTIYTSGDHFRKGATFGHVNFFNDPFATVRFFDPFERNYADSIFPAFSSKIVEKYNKNAYQKLLSRNKDKVYINYSRHQNRYLVIQPDQLMFDRFEPRWLTGKIVLMGYIGEVASDIEDKFFTPMNERFIGKSVPDMNGIVIHANIISMALEDNYIKKLPSWVNWLVAIFLCWLHMSFFIRYYLENHIWFHLVAKLAQVFSIILFSYLGVEIFNQFNMKLDMKYSLIVIVMAVDVIYFYEAFAVWMHKKYHYHTVFHQKHH